MPNGSAVYVGVAGHYSGRVHQVCYERWAAWLSAAVSPLYADDTCLRLP